MFVGCEVVIKFIEFGLVINDVGSRSTTHQ